jgi:hypothetical protein
LPARKVTKSNKREQVLQHFVFQSLFLRSVSRTVLRGAALAPGT